MKELNLNWETKAKLRDVANNYIHSFISPRIPEEIHKCTLIQAFLECFEKSTKKSTAYILAEVNAKSMGWCFDRSNFLNEYWVATSNYGIVQVWGKNKTAVRNYLSKINYGKVLKVVLVKEFNIVSFLEEEGII